MRVVRSVLVAVVVVLSLACSGAAEQQAELARQEAQAAAEAEEARAKAAAEAAAAEAARAEAERAAVEEQRRAVPTSAANSGLWEGAIASASGTRLVLAHTSGEPPPIGANGTLTREVKQKVFGADVTAWLGIADVRVTEVTSDSVTIDVVQEQSVVVINGEKVDHFAPGGGPVKLEWRR